MFSDNVCDIISIPTSDKIRNDRLFSGILPTPGLAKIGN